MHLVLVGFRGALKTGFNTLTIRMAILNENDGSALSYQINSFVKAFLNVYTTHLFGNDRKRSFIIWNIDSALAKGTIALAAIERVLSTELPPHL